MTKEHHHKSQEEEAYGRLIEDKGELLSEAAKSILDAARFEAYKFNLCRNYAYQPFEHEEAMDKMRDAAIELTDRDCNLLGEVWRAALAAAAAIDPDDETPAGHRAGRRE